MFAYSFPLPAEHACGVPANPAGCTHWRVAYVLLDLMPPRDQRGRRRRGRRRNHSFQLDLHFLPPSRAFTGASRLVDRALVDEHGLVPGLLHGDFFANL